MDKLNFKENHADFLDTHMHVNLGNNYKSKDTESAGLKSSQEKGITLVALIITIIILVILAVISIATVYNSKILEHAVHGSYNYTNQSLTENSIMAGTGNLIDSTVDGIGGILTEDRTTVEDVPSESQFTTVANAPDINGFNKSTTFYVAWDLNAEKNEYIPNEVNMQEVADEEKTIPSNWYDYTKGVNEWANVKTTGGGNNCYWVWIPRYAYKVPKKSSNVQTIDIVFLKNTGSTTNDIMDKDKKIEIEESGGFKTEAIPDKWVIHPAFWWDKNNNEVEEVGEQLSGIWVAKFEASSSKVSANTLTSDLASTGGGNTTNLQVRVIPNVTSWRDITINNIFTVCQNLTKEINGNKNSLVNSTNLDAHMMKNIEWGACAYLSCSEYGKNSEVWKNPYYYDTKNYSGITGLAGKEPNSTQYNLTNTYEYNEINGGNASTSGNVYGIYDMAGGALEWVATTYFSGDSTWSSKLWEPSNSKYVDQYKETTGSMSNYYGNVAKYGDAIYETSSDGYSNSAWGGKKSWFISANNPNFYRGISGIFDFGCGDRV